MNKTEEVWIFIQLILITTIFVYSEYHLNVLAPLFTMLDQTYDGACGLVALPHWFLF